MSWTDQIPKYKDNKQFRWAILISLFFLSASSLAFEVSLTRLFSYLFVKSYVYILISISMAGIGFGAVLSHFVAENKRVFLIQTIIFFPVLLLLLLLILSSSGTFLIPSLIFPFLIFIGVGVVQVLIFQESGIKVSKLYASDLIGASFGSIFSFFLLNAGGAVTALIIVVFLISICSIIIYTLYFRKRLYSILFLSILTLLFLSTLFLSFEQKLLPTRTWQKEMTVMLNNENTNPRITKTRWSSFGRVDLLETDNTFFKTMFIDGAAGTKMVNMEGGIVNNALARSLLLEYMGGLPLLVMDDDKKEKAAVIGSGGGIDVVTLLLSGYKHIDAVEINPDFIDIVRELNAYTGNIYNEHPEVSIFLDEGRSFLRRKESTYNVILMGLPIIKSTRSFSNHSLTENYLFTHNAFTEYRRSLKEGGYLIVISHYRNELLRLVTNALTSFSSDGLSPQEALKRIVSIGTDRNPTLILKNEAFTQPEIAGFRAILDNFPVNGSTNFIPNSTDRTQDDSFHKGLLALSKGEIDLNEFLKTSDEDISPVSDNSPFFYNMEQGIPKELLIVGASVSLIIFLTVLLFIRRSETIVSSVNKKSAFNKLICFGLIGFAYMLIEIGILQKFIVFWHHQTLALSVVLSIILVSSGLGSLFSTKIQSIKALFSTVILLSIFVIAYTFFLGPLLISLDHLSSLGKVAVSVIVIAPVFFPMGFFFPYLLRETSLFDKDNKLYPWMIGFNSLTTLGGGILSMILAMSAGYIFLPPAGIFCYILLSRMVIHDSRKKSET